MRLNLFRRWQKRTRGGRRGPFGRAVDAVCPTWSAAPIRPLVQLVSLAFFLWLLMFVCWPYGEEGRTYAAIREGREWLPAETMLSMDPLVGVSSSIAARQADWALAWAGGVLALGLLLPRWFCGFLCPMGTMIDVVDWAVWRWLPKPRLRRRGWMHAKYGVLAAAIAAAAWNVQVIGYAAPLPIAARGLTAVVGPLQQGSLRGWETVPPADGGRWLAIGLFAAVLALGLIAPRFWCRHLCPSGALQSLASFLRFSRRQVTGACISCGRCARACSFDAIREDFSTRPTECTSCQVCGGACPVDAIQFAGRWQSQDSRPPGREAPADAAGRSRRRFLGSAVGCVVAVAAGGAVGAGLRRLLGDGRPAAGDGSPIRPPGAMAEAAFLAACIRCGACMKICPTKILQPMGFEAGFEGLWTPHGACDFAACHPDCNNCGHVCPTGAIRPLSLETKRSTKMGLARVNERACIRCMSCVAACPYGALADANDPSLSPDEKEPPEVSAERCLGCGACQNTCYTVNVAVDPPNVQGGRPAINVFDVLRR